LGPHDLVPLAVGALAGIACSFLNTAASSGSAVSLPMLMMIGLSPIMANATNRVPVLIGAVTASVSFWRGGHIRIPLAVKMCIPVTLGAVVGALVAEYLPGRDLGLIITAAVLAAFLLLFGKLKNAIEAVQTEPERFGVREFVMFLVIGAWLGFIVLDGATYLLMALVLAVHVPLVQANALKTVALIPTTIVALAFFAMDGAIDWGVGATMGIGSVAGGVLGAIVATNATAKVWVFRLLVLVIGGEIVHLAVHYLFGTA
jgi:uncharacterized membrane protein YfcA